MANSGEAIEKFKKTLNYLNDANPLFVSITWAVRNDPGNLAVPNSSSSTAMLSKHACGLENTMLHLTCNGYRKDDTIKHLQQAIDKGVKNILALQGDEFTPKPGEEISECEKRVHYATDLVTWARQLPDRENLTVAVAGHPIGHPATPSYADYMFHLKRKVEAGADFIITQFFFELDDFAKFKEDCRRNGILVPIVPGILLFKNSVSVKKISALSHVTIPQRIVNVLEANKQNPAAVQNYSLHLAFKLAQDLLSKGLSNAVHIFTMNQKKLCGSLLRQLGIWQKISVLEHRLLTGNENKSGHNGGGGAARSLTWSSGLSGCAYEMN